MKPRDKMLSYLPIPSLLFAWTRAGKVVHGLAWSPSPAGGEAAVAGGEFGRGRFFVRPAAAVAVVRGSDGAGRKAGVEARAVGQPCEFGACVRSAVVADGAGLGRERAEAYGETRPSGDPGGLETSEPLKASGERRWQRH